MIWTNIYMCFLMAPTGGPLHNEILALINSNEPEKVQIKKAMKIIKEKC